MMFREYLVSVQACPDAILWVGDRSPSEAWHACQRPDWLLWLCGRVAVDRRLIVLCATGCARSVLHLVPPDEDRPRQAVEAAEAWAYGRGSAEDAEAAYAAAWAATLGAGAAEAALAATESALAATGAVTQGDAESALAAAGAAGWAAWAADRAAWAAGSAAHRRYARGVREVILWTHVANGLRAAGVAV
jgi:hypothetical protein